MRFAAVFHALGAIIFVFGLTMTVPLTASWISNDGALATYDEALAITLGCGALTWFLLRPHATHELRVRDGFLLVTLTWVATPLFGALPLLLQVQGLSLPDAWFESVSGLTTTGATVLTGLDALPYSINLWRCFLHWIGGMGVIVLAVAVLPLLGIGGRQLFRAETPGPMKETGLTPRIAETAKGLWFVYVLLTVACMLALRLAGMPVGDSIMHAFSITGLGGFSSHDASLGYFNSMAIEMTAIVFALLSGVNFTSHYLALRQRSVVPWRCDAELPFFFAILGLSIVGITVYLLVTGVPGGFADTLRKVAFHLVSMSTSLGFSATDTGSWPMFTQVWGLFLGSFVACSGSTGGGVKMVRAILLYKLVFRELLRAMHPRVMHPLRFGRRVVDESILHSVLAFSFMYVAVFALFTLLLLASGMNIVTAFSATAACINNIGPGLNEIGPAGNYAGLSDFQKLLCTAAMIIGRLEILTVLVVLTPAFWRK